MNARKFYFLIPLILLLTLGVLPQVQAKSQTDALETRFQAALDEYVLVTESSQHFELGKIHTDGRWAFATAQTAETSSDQKSAGSYVVLLAHNDPQKGWIVLAPTEQRVTDYNALLEQFPEDMIDVATKAYLTRPEARDMAVATANSSDHRLPWPAGYSALVRQRDGTNHYNQIDFNIYGTDTIYATKPGKVVFVKESSNASCTTPPPDSCWKKANMVVVEHDSGEYSWYVHLAYNSVPVVEGAYVGLGTKIGVEGTTGYSTGVHLHYMSSTGHTAWTDRTNPNDAPWGTGITAVDFEENAWSQLQVGQTYASHNTSDPAAVSWGNGRIDLFVHGEDNALWHKTFDGQWGNWTSMDGILVSAPDAASWGSGHIDVYVRGLDNNIYYKRYLNNSWANWDSAGQPPVGATSDPSAVSRSYGQIDLFVRGGDDQLWHRIYSNGDWGAWQSLEGVLAGSPDASSWSSTHIDVYVRGADDALWYRRYNNGSWGGWQSRGGVLTADPGAVSPGFNQSSVFVRGITKVLWHLPYSSGWGDWEPLDGYLISGPDAASWGSGHLDVFVRGTDNRVYHRWYLGGWSGWESQDKP